MQGTARCSKEPPVKWLDRWLARNAPDVPDKYVVMDQGGKVGHCPEILAAFAKHQHAACLTGADASYQNGPVEPPNQTIGDAIRSMLLDGGALAGKFWPCAFDLHHRIHNALPIQGTDNSQASRCTKHQDDFIHLQTFGCRVWVRPPGKRSAKLALHAKRGIFLGYPPDATKNIIWFDLETCKVKLAVHVCFNKGTSDVNPAPPNVEHLHCSQGANIPAKSIKIPPLPLISTSNPFLHLSTKNIKILCDSPTFGLELTPCPIRCRPYISDISPGSLASTLCSSQRRAKRKHLGAFIISVNDAPTYCTLDEVRAAFDSTPMNPSATTFTVDLAPEALPNAKVRADSENLLLGVDQLCAIHLLCSKLLGLDSTANAASDNDIKQLLHALSLTASSPAERALGSFTCRKLVLRQHWMCKSKSNGAHCARNCCDGSKHAAPELHRLSSQHLLVLC
jgi:hypothetical protein